MLKTFIERPVLSTVISILLTILGILGLISLPLEQYPEIAPPTVQVSATYTGANAETVLNSVIIPLEEQINGVENMTYMTSSASNDGNASISVFFELGTNPDMAAVNVQNRVARATSKLPAIVNQTGVTTVKSQNSALMFVSFYSENPNYDGTFVQNFANINIVPKLQRVKGVGQVTVFGAKDYSMRIWIDPEKMSAYKITPSDIQAALQEQNIEAAPGKFGDNSDGVYEYAIKYTGRFNKESQYEDIILKTLGNNNYVRLQDVAKVELGAFNYSVNNYGMGKPGVAMGIFQTSGSNANEITTELNRILQEEAKSFPEGIKYVVPMDSKTFLDASINKVISTLIEAFILVFIVVYLFLQDLRSTLIPGIAVPVAIIGTFFFLQLFGFSINMLTLFAMILAIGIVVDDAIVVVEAVHAKLEEGYTDAKEATISAMNEITGAIVSITLVMSAVFIPVSFLSGPSGVFYKQFAITLAVSIIISAINALTLSPALCAILLKPHQHGEHKKQNFKDRFFVAFNAGFDSLTNKYVGAVKKLISNKWITGVILLGASGIAYWLFATTPSGFIPTEDRGAIMMDVTMPAGTTLQETQKVLFQLDTLIASTPGVKERMMVAGRSIINSVNGGSYGMGIIKLDDFENRKDESLQVQSIVNQLFGKVAQFKDARIIFITPPSVQGFGNADGFEVNLQNKNDEDYTAMNASIGQFLQALNARPEIQYAMTNFNPTFPQYQMDVDVERAKNSGVSVTNIINTMQGYYGGLYTTDFNRFGKQYRVMIQAEAKDRDQLASIDKINVINAGGQMIPISQFVTFTKIYGPEAVSRFNLLKSAKVTGKANAGYSSGDAIKAVQEVAAQHLPASYGYEFSGMSREEILAGNESVLIFLLCLVFVYFLLAGQYESYILPFAVIFSLPVGIAGAIIFINLAGLENNIYFQVALVMLIGLLAKNAILIVEYAVQRRKHGMSLFEAAFDGAQARLRPILMTSFAFILGLVPLAFATGVGAVGNRSIGMGAVGGMLIGTLLGVFVIPVLFVIFQGIQEKVSPIKFEPKPENKNE